ncbi:MAG: hypothetical protein J0L50_01445 [Sphingomonadales bacterium]|nr:hypothetical protein [Sphingomonadales bacterium]
MFKYSLKLAGLAAFAASAVLPAPAIAQAQDYDKATYDLLMDCVTLQILFAGAAENEAQKNDSATMAAAYLSAANVLTGTEVKDLGAEIKPRRDRIMGWISSDDPRAKRLTMSCGAIFRVGKDYLSMSKK